MQRYHGGTSSILYSKFVSSGGDFLSSGKTSVSMEERQSHHNPGGCGKETMTCEPVVETLLKSMKRDYSQFWKPVDVII
ncbi:unnamed protein product [Allacma fusca]|uniref:Uncharacterized protein n=1 Tax=Allacma fusca TaxID=39272 RepID=A0A8J2PT33_9HEXA|nr:unnamed protein product [Allacma fusca]